jgi:mitochondrial fission protein ELM1
MSSFQEQLIPDEKPLVVWRFIDGKAGHEAQTLGLVQALARRRTVECVDFEAPGRWKAAWSWLTGSFPEGADLSEPDLIIGAGHRTHFSLLAARRAYGGKTVVLMKPSVPASLFDLCLVPQHDAPRSAANVIETVGVLNPMQPAANARAGRGLLLIGGPSKHHGWHTAALVGQVQQVLAADREMQWVLTTSRRTPEDCEAALVALDEPNLKVVPVGETQRGWVAERLQECASAWVSEDSVSMVFEALTAGAAVGLLSVPSLGVHSRVHVAAESLLEAGRVVRFEECLKAGDFTLPPSSNPLAEADRCADEILTRFCLSEGELLEA